MRPLARTIANWLSLRSERGVTAIEYGLIAALIAVVIIGGVTLVGTRLSTVYSTVGNKLSAGA